MEQNHAVSVILPFCNGKNPFLQAEESMLAKSVSIFGLQSINTIFSDGSLLPAEDQGINRIACQA